VAVRVTLRTLWPAYPLCCFRATHRRRAAQNGVAVAAACPAWWVGSEQSTPRLLIPGQVEPQLDPTENPRSDARPICRRPAGLSRTGLPASGPTKKVSRSLHRDREASTRHLQPSRLLSPMASYCPSVEGQRCGSSGLSPAPRHLLGAHPLVAGFQPPNPNEKSPAPSLSQPDQFRPRPANDGQASMAPSRVRRAFRIRLLTLLLTAESNTNAAPQDLSKRNEHNYP